MDITKRGSMELQYMSSEMNTFQYDGREKRQSELKFLYIINYGCGSKGLGTPEFTKKG